jgi:hypothetical protein
MVETYNDDETFPYCINISSEEGEIKDIRVF